MLEKFFPDLTYNRVSEINLDLLKEKGIKGFILDIDNTLVPNHAEADENAVRWMEKIQKEGFKVCIVSNASKKRVIKFNERLKVNAIHRASKPGSKAFKAAFKLMGLTSKEAVIVGDQIFTDIYGGKRVGILTILVTPIDKKESVLIKLKRVGEKIVLKRYKKQLGTK
ncbi:MAG: YqeG family HAD IIIA-type phosphatase [Bacillota bacterium]|nr:YqeG family HAD IIIA-type phosphatase [Bacillota bacterium]